MKNLLALMLAIAEIEKMCETDNKVQKLAENLDKLNQNGSNQVQVNLTISGVSIKFDSCGHRRPGGMGCYNNVRRLGKT